ncbi:MAG: DNA-directed RNA polymerase subunit beta' [Bacilli bacterium]
MLDTKQLSAMQINLASPEKIREWSHGEVTKPETINYRSQKPEMDGLFCEKIFGPSKDYECHCGKYKKIRYSGLVCDRCGVEVTTKDVRRERMGHIELAAPCSHIWYLKGIPSRMGLLLDIPPKELEDVIYYNAHIVLDVGISKTLRYKQFINEKTGRVDFVQTLKEVADLISDKSIYDYSIVENYIESLQGTSQTFDYYGIVNIFHKYLKAEFGEGGEAVERLLKDVDLTAESIKIRGDLKGASTQRSIKLVKRLEVIEAFKNSTNEPQWMILRTIPVIPPDLRPMLPLDGGRYATSDLNDLYRRVITRNNRLKKLKEMNSPKVILMNESRMLQEAVDALIDNGRRNGKPVVGAGNRPLKSLSSILKGKQGRFRQNLLGKRVDYSGRSVIAVGPDLKMYQCGIPREMAIKLLRPFIAYELINDKIAASHAQADKMIDRQDSEVFDEVEKIIDRHPVLLNRAPTLHRLGIQAFQPKLVDGRAIRLHPLVCTGFNADFDGDQMAVHVPLYKEAQEEALNLMLASNNILGPKDGKPICIPSQDMVLGNYYLTLEADKKYFADRAEEFTSQGDLEEAEIYKGYLESEGKVFCNVNEVLMAYQSHKVHLHNRIAIIGKALIKDNFTPEMNESYLITTVGKVIFNLVFPSDFPYLNELSPRNLSNLKADDIKFFAPKGSDIKSLIAAAPLRTPFTKKVLEPIISEIFARYGTSKTSAVIDKIKDQGFKYSTISGITVSISDINVSSNKEKIVSRGDGEVAAITTRFNDGELTDEERHDEVCKVWDSIGKEVSKDVEKSLKSNPRNPLYMMSDSGARGNISNFTQLMGMRGLMANTSGETIELPVKSCFREGLNVSEFFTGTHGARKGGADTALKTADSGYLTRRLVDVSQDVIIREEDCHTDHGTIVKDIIDSSRGKVLVSLYDRLVGRFSLNDIIDEQGNVVLPANTLIDEHTAEAIVEAGVKQVEIRSLFGCETRDGVCVHCYGRNLADGKLVQVGQAVGIMAAQSIGEPGTQLTMRTFHTGGVAGTDITQGLPRVQELFEARNPKGIAIISEISGSVTDIKPDSGTFIVTVTNDIEEKQYKTGYGAKLRVKLGDKVINGQKITEGAISPKELLEVSDVAAVEKYITKEVHKVYSSQGILISDKHIEVIIRQMLKKVVIIDNGDTDMLPGTRVSLLEFTDKNAIALEAGLRPAAARPLILGITKAALETDSFLSAASFQETTRVLTDAALKGKKDILHGLKENVITGRLIPAGRGLLSEDEEAKLMENFDVLERMQEVKDNYIGVHDYNGTIKEARAVQAEEENETLDENVDAQIDQ